MYRFYLKRIIDLTTSFILIIVLSPILLILTTLLWFHFNGNPFFTQQRLGYLEEKIRIIKFKTMTNDRNGRGNLLPDKERLTSVGKFIRSLSLDELPQLINVLKGDMSLIGPRPLLFKYLPLYSQEQRRRHKVRPGITGWAQINGRNSISWQKKFEYDVYYVDNLSFWFDLKILFLTMVKVIMREGVNQSNERPMLPFNGLN